MLRVRWAVSLVCVVVVFLVVGCGSSTDSATISSKAFTRKANPICFEENGKTETKILKGFEDPRFKQVKAGNATLQLEADAVLPGIVEEAEALKKRIGALGSPGGRETEIETLLTAYATWINKAKKEPTKVVANNDLFDHARELAGKYGLEKCEQSPLEVPAA